MKYIDVTRTTNTSLDVLLEKQIEDYWNVDGEKFQRQGQDSQDSLKWAKGHLTDIHSPGGDLRGNKQPQYHTLYGQMCRNLCLMQRKRKHNKDGLSRNRSSIRPEERLRSIFVIEPDEEFKRTMKVARRELEIPMPAAEALKNSNERPQRNLPQYWETQDQICLYCRSWRNSENSIGKRTAHTSRRSHCCKRYEFTQSLQFGTQVHSDVSSIKSTGYERCSGEIMV